jgi:hypothetical protein
VPSNSPIVGDELDWRDATLYRDILTAHANTQRAPSGRHWIPIRLPSHFKTTAAVNSQCRTSGKLRLQYIFGVSPVQPPLGQIIQVSYNKILLDAAVQRVSEMQSSSELPRKVLPTSNTLPLQRNLEAHNNC